MIISPGQIETAGDFIRFILFIREGTRKPFPVMGPVSVQRQLHLPIDDNYTYPFLMTIISLPRVLNLRMGETEVAPL